MSELNANSSHPLHGWLAAVLPASARRIRAEEPELAATLGGAGLELVDQDPDVEIASPQRLRGDAPHALVSLRLPLHGERSRLVRVRKRILGSLEVRVRAQRARREVQRRGYPSAEVITWDLEHPMSLQSGISPRVLRAAELLPLGAIVVGSNSPRTPTVLEAAAEAAMPAASGSLRPGRALVRATGLIVIGEQEVLRVAVGPARILLHRQRTVLELLRAAGPPDSVAALAPWPVAHGTTGIADWSLERRLPGNAASPSLGDSFVEDCCEFLVALHTAGAQHQPRGSLRRAAGVVALTIDDERAHALATLAQRVEASLGDLPRGFAQGDFWSGNLLTEKGRLVGVVDWAAAAVGALPLVDFIHLRLSARRWATNEPLGRLLVEEMLPWARDGGDEQSSIYSERLGFEPTPERLEALVIAYWLDRVGHELETYSNRRQPKWLRSNVEPVLAAVGLGNSRASSC